MFRYIDKLIYDLYKNKILFIYILYISFVALLSLVFTYQLITTKLPDLVDSDNNIIISHMQFGYGPLIENLYNGQGYAQMWNGKENYLARLPFLPLFTTLILNLSLNIYIILLIKNLIFFSFYFYFVHLFCRSQNKGHICFLSLLIIIFYNFYNLITNLNFIFADAYTGIALPMIFLILSSKFNNRSIILGVIIFCIYLTKTTMLFPTLTITILYFFFEKNSSLLRRFIPLIFLLVSMTIWGTFGYLKTGVFAIGSKISSSNQEALNFVMNDNFHKFYPVLSVDLIPKNKSIIIFENEWDTSEHFKKLNLEYFQNNKTRVYKDILLKLKFIFFNIRKDATNPKIHGANYNPIMFSHLINRIIVITSIIIGVICILKNFSQKRFDNLEFYFLGIFFSSIFPHVIGWATSKHLVGVFIICHIYLFLKLKQKFFSQKY